METTKSPLSATDAQYFDLIRRAAIMQREFLGLNATERFRNDQGGQVFYVFDTDVFPSYANSLLKGPLTGGSRNGYGQLLPRRYNVLSLSHIQDEQDRQKVKTARYWEDRYAVIVARRLAETALDHGETTVGRRDTFLQLDSHFEETRGMLSAVQHQLVTIDWDAVEQQQNHLREKVKQALQALLQILEKSQAQPGTGPSVADFLGIIIGEIMRREMQSETAPIYEAANYQRLGIWGDSEEWQNGRMSLSDFATLKENRKFFGNFAPHRTAENVLRLLWNGLLKDTKHREKNREQDVVALTQLTLWNQYLYRNARDWGGEKARIVFLTGDTGILEASYRAPEKLQQNLERYVKLALPETSQSERYKTLTELERFFGFERSNSDHPWFDRFSLYHVRHIRAFSREVLFENHTRTESGEHLGDLFDGLFADEARTLMRSRRSLERLVMFPKDKEKPPEFQRNFEEALDKWNQMVARAVGNKRLDELHNQSDVRGFIETIANILLFGQGKKPEWDTLADWLLEHVDRIRDETMIPLSGLGAGTLKKSEVTHPPDLYFDTLTNCQNIFRKLATESGYLGSRQLVTDFENIGRDCYPETETERGEGIQAEEDSAERSDRRWEHHLQFLVLAAVFASAQKWSIAEEHARRATTIIERAQKLGEQGKIQTKEEKSNPSGREAYFLRAICTRIRAQTDNDLKMASEFLEKAIAAFQDDREKNPEHPLPKFRYFNEKLSIALSRYYLTRLDGEECRNSLDGDSNTSLPSSDGDGSQQSDFGKRIKDVCAGLSKTWEELKEQAEFAGHLDINAPFPAQITGMYTALNVLQLATIFEYWKNRAGAEIDSVSKAWKSAIAEAFSPEADQQHVDKAFEYLKHVNSEDTQLRSTKMAKAYEISGALILEKDMPTHSPDRDAVKKLFDLLRQELRAEYDKWRVDNLEKFILGRLPDNSDSPQSSDIFCGDVS